MSSPAASASGGDGEKSDRKPLEQITFRFCSECSNLLYPKEDENENKLMFTCRTCKFSEEATSSCIYRNVLNNAAGETAGVTQDVGSDPTVGDTSLLPKERIHGHWDSSASAYALCLCCGVIIICEVCHEHFAVVPSDSDASEPEDQETHLVEFESEGVYIRPWNNANDQDLAAFMARRSDLFGSWMNEMEDGDMDLDNGPESQYLIGETQSLSALVPSMAH